MKNANNAFMVTPARITIVRFHTGWRSEAPPPPPRRPPLRTRAQPVYARPALPRRTPLEPARVGPRDPADRVLAREKQLLRHFVGRIERGGCGSTGRGGGAPESVRRVQLG